MPAELQSVPHRPSSTSRRQAISRRRPNTIAFITYVLGTAEFVGTAGDKDCASAVEVSSKSHANVGTEDVCAIVGTEDSKSKTESEVSMTAKQLGPEGKRKHIMVGTEVNHDVGRWRRGAGIGKGGIRKQSAMEQMHMSTVHMKLRRSRHCMRTGQD